LVNGIEPQASYPSAKLPDFAPRAQKKSCQY